MAERPTLLGNCSRNLASRPLLPSSRSILLKTMIGRLALRPDFRQNRVDRRDLLRRLRMPRVHHMHQQVRLRHLLQRRLEGLHQPVRQLADKPDRVSQ